MLHSSKLNFNLRFSMKNALLYSNQKIFSSSVYFISDQISDYYTVPHFGKSKKKKVSSSFAIQIHKLIDSNNFKKIEFRIWGIWGF
jgi:hypothetical protein